MVNLLLLKSHSAVQAHLQFSVDLCLTVCSFRFYCVLVHKSLLLLRLNWNTKMFLCNAWSTFEQKWDWQHCRHSWDFISLSVFISLFVFPVLIDKKVCWDKLTAQMIKCLKIMIKAQRMRFVCRNPVRMTVLCAAINSVYLFHSVTNNVIPDELVNCCCCQTAQHCESKAVCDTGCFKKRKQTRVQPAINGAFSDCWNNLLPGPHYSAV